MAARVFVIGMHRSGTSAVARILNLMGCYIGPQDLLIPPKEDNPRGFWEREDVCRLNTDALETLGGEWHTLTDPDLGRIEPRRRAELVERARGLVTELDARAPWIVKDPRLCVTFPLWREVVDDPVVVLVHRRPLQVAQSLKARDGFPLAVGVALWECYTLAALRATSGVPRVLISHAEVLGDPAGASVRLHRALEEFGATGLEAPDAAAVEAFVSRNLFRARGDGEEEQAFLNPARSRLLAALEAGDPDGDWSSEQLSSDARDLLEVHGRFVEAERRREQIERQRDALYVEHNELAAERDALFVEKAALTAERDELYEVVADRDALYLERNELAAERDELFVKTNELAAERDELFVEKEALVVERDELYEVVADRDALYVERNELAEERDRLYLERNEVAAERDTLWSEKVTLEERRDALEHVRHRLETERDGLAAALAASRLERDQLVASLSFRVGRVATWPLRAARRLLKRAPGRGSR